MFQATFVIIFIISILLLGPSLSPIIAEKNEDDNKEENKPKEYCKDYGGEWDDDREKCEIEDEEERTYYEDDVCDDEDAETTNIDMCSSEDLKFGQAFAEKYNKENCENHNGEWKDSECDFYENQMQEGWEIDEDNFY